MNRAKIPAAIVITLALLAVVSPAPAGAQPSPKQQIVGAWTIVSTDTIRPDGTRVPTFGPTPRGVVIFDASGRYALELMRATAAPFASNNRLDGTADENKAVVQGSLAHFGRYSVNEAERTLILHMEGSTFPNWNGTDQRRTFTVSGDELRWSTPAASGGGSAELVWKRAK
jgi:hypothetical protein